MKINERTLIEGLSYALDVAEKSYFSHSKHVAYTSIMIANEMKLSIDEKKNLYYAALLHDIGAGNSYTIEEHCINGREILLELPVDQIVSEYVNYHHEHLDGTGPFNLKGSEISIPAQIICLADLFDYKFGRLTDVNFDDIDEMKKMINFVQNQFYPEIIFVFKKILDQEYFVLDYYNKEFNNIVSKKVDVEGKELEFQGIKAFADAFARIIDNRSHFTHRHSVGVAELAMRIASQLGYNHEIENKMYIAGLLHDIGKLIVSNDIIDKEGKLNNKERYEINKHTYYTRWILEQINGFEDITEIASNHHEKLNGNGYPLHLTHNQIGELDRIMAICDIFQALTEERPYRDKMSLEKVWSIIDRMVSNGELDKALVERIKIIV